MKAVSILLYRALAGGSFLLLAALPCAAQQAVAPVSNPCQRPAAGTVVQNPPALYSSGHFLQVRFSYQHAFDAAGRELFCFMTPDGKQNPTLHLNPGDHLFITLTNNLPAGSSPMGLNGPNCGATVMTDTSVNIHYHGTNTSPTCQQDEVIKTIINSGRPSNIMSPSRSTNHPAFTGTIRTFMDYPNALSREALPARSSLTGSRTFNQRSAGCGNAF